MGRPLYGYVCDGYWQDIGNLDQYRQANFDALDERVELDIPGIRLRGNIWLGEGVEIDDLEGVEGPAFIGNYCRHLAGGDRRRRTRCSARASRCASARASCARSSTPSTYVGRSALDRGRDRRPRRATSARTSRIHEGVAIGDEVVARRAERRHARRADLPVQGGRVRRARPRERDLGVRAATSALFGRDGVSGLVNVDLTPEVAVRLAAALGTALQRGARVVASRESPRGVPDDQARDGRRPHLDRDRRRRPARAARRRSTGTCCKTQGYDAGFHVGVSPTDPEMLQIRFFEQPGIQLTPRSRRRSRSTSRARSSGACRFAEIGSVSYPARVRESYAQDLLDDARRRRDPRARLPARRRLRRLGGVVRPPARPRPARGRGGRRARVHDRRRRPTASLRGVARPGEAARRGGRRRPRRRPRPRGRAALPRRRAGPRDRRSSRRCCSSCACSARPGRAGTRRVPGHRHEPRSSELAGEQRARGRAHAGVARRADAGGRRGRHRLRGRGRRRRSSSREFLPAYDAVASLCILLELLAPVDAAALGARRRAARARRVVHRQVPARGR